MATPKLDGLGNLAVRLLWSLPIEPNGLSLHELADGLLGRRDPAAVGRIVDALHEVEAAVGAISIRVGTDDFGRHDVKLCGIPADRADDVRAAFAARVRSETPGGVQ